MRGLGKRGISFSNLVVYCLSWYVWMERDRKIFEDQEDSIGKCCDKIKFRVLCCNRGL